MPSPTTSNSFCSSLHLQQQQQCGNSSGHYQDWRLWVLPQPMSASILAGAGEAYSIEKSSFTRGGWSARRFVQSVIKKNNNTLTCLSLFPSSHTFSVKTWNEMVKNMRRFTVSFTIMHISVWRLEMATNMRGLLYLRFQTLDACFSVMGTKILLDKAWWSDSYKRIFLVHFLHPPPTKGVSSRFLQFLAWVLSKLEHFRTIINHQSHNALDTAK